MAEEKKINLTPDIAKQIFNNQRQLLERILAKRSELERAVFELEKTISSLDALSESKEGFMSLGNGVYVEVNFKDTSKVLFNIGSDVVMPKTIDAVKESLEKRKNSFIKQFNELSKKEEELNKSLEFLYNFILASQQKLADQHKDKK